MPMYKKIFPSIFFVTILFFTTQQVHAQILPLLKNDIKTPQQEREHPHPTVTSHPTPKPTKGEPYPTGTAPEISPTGEPEATPTAIMEATETPLPAHPTEVEKTKPKPKNDDDSPIPTHAETAVVTDPPTPTIPPPAPKIGNTTIRQVLRDVRNNAPITTVLQHVLPKDFYADNEVTRRRNFILFFAAGVFLLTGMSLLKSAKAKTTQIPHIQFIGSSL